jgi:predicted chitinase
MLTIEQLRAIMPNLTQAKGRALFPFLAEAIAEFGIETPARMAAFLAQVAHESGELRFLEEIWGPTPAQRRYEPASTLAVQLGNTDPGDGRRFKGRGPIQITGRGNYRRFGDALGLDLVSDPARAAKPEVGFRTAGLFWMRNGLNEIADRGSPEAFRLITKRINGGLNGLADRERFYAAARAVLGVPETPGVPEARGRGVAPGRAVARFDRGYEAIEAAGARTRRPRAPRHRRTRAAAPPRRKRTPR